MISRPDLVAVTRLIPRSRRKCWETKGWDNFVAPVSALTDEGSWASAHKMRSRDVADRALNSSAAPERDSSSAIK